jgi:uroporphyrinogen-III synthase
MHDPSDPQCFLIFHRTSQIVSSGMSIDNMLNELIALTVEFMQCDACLIYLPDYETDEIVLRASLLPHAAEIGHVRMKIGEGVTGWVAKKQSIVALSNHAYADSRFKNISALIEDTFEAFLSVPLVNCGKVTGVMNIQHKNPREHTAEEISTMTFLGEQIGCAIAYAELSDEHTKLQMESREIREQLEVRKLAEIAKSVLQQRYQMSEKSAYQRLRDESRRLRKPLRAIAEAVLMVEEMMRTTANAPAADLDDSQDAPPSARN